MRLALFSKVLEMNLTASFVILVVLFVRILLKRAPKVFSYLLWGIVLFRLLCPISFSLSTSFIPARLENGDLIQHFSNTYVGDYHTYQDTATEYLVAVEQGIEPIIKIDKTGEISGAYVITDSDGISKPNTLYNTVFPLISHIWIAGSFLLILYSIVSLLKLKKKTIGSVPYDDECDIYINDYVNTAFVIGVFYPRIYLPSSLSKEEIEYILLHEKYHIRRKDHIVKILFFIALCMHWFNPLVWIAFSLFGKDMEMSCDEAVLKKQGEAIREGYSQSLLSLATGKRIISGMPLAFGEGNTKERIINALNWKRCSRKVFLTAALVCTIVAIGCFFNPSKEISLYDWTNTITTEKLKFVSVTIWNENKTDYEIDLTEEQIADLVYVLNHIPYYQFSDSNEADTLEKIQLTISVRHDDQTYLLKYGNGITALIKGSQVCYVTDDKLTNFMQRVISSSNISTEHTGTAAPTLADVERMREQVFQGMSEEEITYMKTYINKYNFKLEEEYVYGEHFEKYSSTESKAWDFLSDEEHLLNAKLVIATLTKMKNSLKTDLLVSDFDTMIHYMELLQSTHDVVYLKKFYYILHDMDYFLFQYGPVDLGMYMSDRTTVSKYYGVLSVYPTTNI